MNTQYRKNLKAVLEASKNYTDKVAKDLQWQLGTYDLGVETVNGTTMLLPTPENTIQATMVRIDGKSVKCSNLVQNNTATTQYVDTDQFLAELLPSTTYTISFVSSASGEFTLRSVYSAIDLLYAQSVSIGLNSYTFTTPSNYTNTGNYLYFYATSDVVGTELRINDGSIALPYEPYYSGIHNLELSGLKVEGANLISEIKQNSAYRFNFIAHLKPNTTYFFSSNKSLQAPDLRLYNTTHTTLIATLWANNYGKSTSGMLITTPSDILEDDYYVEIGINDGAVNLGNAMLNYGNTAKTYAYYVQPTTLPIDLTSIEDSDGNKLFADGSLKGVGTAKDYITPYLAHKQMGSYTFTGEETWTRIGVSYGTPYLDSLVKYLSDNNQIINALIIGFTPDTANNVYAGNNDNTISGINASNPNRIRIYSSSIDSQTDAQNATRGKTIVFELATPIEADIDLSQLVKFEAYSNGSITLVNTNNQDTTSTFKYLKEVAK